MRKLADGLTAFFGRERAIAQPGGVLHVASMSPAEAATVLRSVASLVETGEIEMKHLSLSSRGLMRGRENQALSFFLFG